MGTKWHEMWHAHPESPTTTPRVSFADGVGAAAEEGLLSPLGSL